MANLGDLPGDGNLDDTDLSGVNLGLVNLFPSNLTSGNWKLGIFVDENASDEQANALERIVKGEEGGVFEQFAALRRQRARRRAAASQSAIIRRC